MSVKVFDQDAIRLGPFSLEYRKTQLGETTTDNDGFYSVSYGEDKYGGSVDEDKVETRAAEGSSWRHPLGVPAEYGPGNPDLLIEVYRGGTLLKRSDVFSDVGDTEFTINLDIASDTPPERSPLEVIGDAAADAAPVVANGIATVISAVTGVAATIVGVVPVVGPAGSEFLTQAGNTFAGIILNFGTWLQYTWEMWSDRPIAAPGDLWDLCRQRYGHLKREVLLRHFLPPWNDDARYIPYYVTEFGMLGFRDPAKRLAPRCHAAERYGCSVKTEAGAGAVRLVIEGEIADFDAARTRREKDTSGAAGLSWAEFRRHLPTYARTYENGLAYTGAFVGAIAYEHALLPAGVDPRERLDCENILALTLDTLEDLERRGGLSGYLIRYDERGDGFEPFGRVTASCGFFQTGLTQEVNYCSPVGPPPPSGTTDPSLRFRKFEPSGDEYSSLIEGLAVAYSVLPSGSAARERAGNLLARIHRYLEEHYYYLMRPCGNLSVRGSVTTWYEYPWSSFFEQALGVPTPQEERAETPEVFSKAGLGPPTLLYECPADDPPNLDLPNPRLFVPGDLNIDEQEMCALVGAELVRSNRRISTVDRHRLLSSSARVPGVPYWTLNILAKCAALGKWSPAAKQNLSETFHFWHNVADVEHSGGAAPQNHSWNQITMAASVALDGQAPTLLWERWRTFFGNENIFPMRRLPCLYERFITVTRDDGSVDRVDTERKSDPLDGLNAEEFLRDREHALIYERGEAGAANVMWPVATVAHSLGMFLFSEPTPDRPETTSLATMKVPAPAPAYAQTLPGVTVRDLLNEQMEARAARLNEAAAHRRPVFIVHPGSTVSRDAPFDLEGTELFDNLVAARGDDRVFVINTPDDTDTKGRAKHLGDAVAASMDGLRARRELPDLSFDLIGYSTGGLVARMLLLMFPSALKIYWPNNLVLLATPNRGMHRPPNRMPDLNEAAGSLGRRKHHHDVRIFTCVGRVPGLDGDGFVNVSDASLSSEEAITIVEQKVINNVLHAPAQFLTPSLSTTDLPWYFVDADTAATVLAWSAQPPSHIRYPYSFTAA